MMRVAPWTERSSRSSSLYWRRSWSVWVTLSSLVNIWSFSFAWLWSFYMKQMYHYACILYMRVNAPLCVPAPSIFELWIQLSLVLPLVLHLHIKNICTTAYQKKCMGNCFCCLFFFLPVLSCFANHFVMERARFKFLIQPSNSNTLSNLFLEVFFDGTWLSDVRDTIFLIATE